MRILGLLFMFYTIPVLGGGMPPPPKGVVLDMIENNKTGKINAWWTLGDFRGSSKKTLATTGVCSGYYDWYCVSRRVMT